MSFLASKRPWRAAFVIVTALTVLALGAVLAHAQVLDETAPRTFSDREATYLDSATITLFAFDEEGGSGVAETYFALDGAPYSAGTTVTCTTAGTHTLSFYSEDASGNVEVPTLTSFLIYDTLAPTTTSDAHGVYEGSATIHLTATDGAGSGVAATYYCLDEGDTLAGSTISVTAIGEHTLSFYSVDEEGNTEEPKTATFEVADTTPPLTVSDASAVYLDCAQITLTATDPSGIDQIFYSIDGGTPVGVSISGGDIEVGTPAPAGHFAEGNAGDPGTTCGTCHTITEPPPAEETDTTKSCVVTISVAGSHTLTFWATDKAGNEEEAKSAFFTVIDTIAPTTTSDAKASYEPGPATIHLTATDNAGGSGVAATLYALDEGAETAGSIITVSAKGSHTLRFYSVDNDGNTEAAHSVTFRVGDTTPPRTVSDVSAVYENVATIHLTATDPSGVASIHYQVDGGAPVVFGIGPDIEEGTPAPAGHAGTGNAGDPGTNCAGCHTILPHEEPPPPPGATTREVTVTVSAAGSHTLTFFSVDSEGNAEAPCTAYFTVLDTIAPTTTSDCVATYTGPATIHLTAIDNAGGSGVEATFYALDGGAQVEGTEVNVSATGSHTLTFFSEDEDGNVEDDNTCTFTIVPADSTPPVTTSDAVSTYEGTATIILTATDAGSGVKEIRYAVDGGAEVVCGIPGAPDLPTNAVSPGVHYVTGPAGAGCSGCHTMLTEASPDIAAGTPAPAGHAGTGNAGDAGTSCALCHTITGGVEPLPASKTCTVTVGGVGSHTLTFFAVDGAENAESPHTVTFTIEGEEPPPGATVTRIFGEDRYETATGASASFGDGDCDAVVLARGDSFADALSGAGLAGVLDAPLLLTTRDELPGCTQEEIARVCEGQDATVYIVGGTAAVSDAVASSLEEDYTVLRVAGDDRYATAAAVAAKMDALDPSVGDSVFVARGDTFPDALALAPLSYAAHIPVLLTPTDSLAEASEDAINALMPADIYIAGGTGAVSSDVKDALSELADTVTRVAGDDRYETAAAIAAFGVDSGWVDAGYVGVATGTDFPDALSGGAACGAGGGVLLLTAPDALSTAAEGFITGNAASIHDAVVFGGTSVVDPVVMARISDLLD